MAQVTVQVPPTALEPVTGVNVAQYLPFDYVTDGSVVYTSQIQAAISAALIQASALVFPAGTFVVAGLGLLLELVNGQGFCIRGAGLRNTFLKNLQGPVLRLKGEFITMNDITLWSVGGGHVIQQTGVVAHSAFNSVSLIQEANNYSLWDNNGYGFISNQFGSRCYFQAPVTSTVYPWNLTTAGGDINDNIWSDSTAFGSGTKHHFNLESTGATAQASNTFSNIDFEICRGGGIRARAVDGIKIDTCLNWDAGDVTTPVVNHFFDIDRNAVPVNCTGVIAYCGRRAGLMASGKYDLSLPAGGGGAGMSVIDCRGAGDLFTVNNASNLTFIVGLIGSTMSVANATNAWVADLLAGKVTTPNGVIVGANQVIGARKPGWTPATGTATRTTFVTSTVTLPQLAEHVKALIDDLHATAGHGLIGT